jgi:pyrroline-5-carboxylate reductase
MGAGKMVEAILKGLMDHEDLSCWHIYSPSATSAKNLALSVGARAITNLDDISPDWILLGCKPQQINDLALVLGTRFKNQPYVSLLAALTEVDQRKILNTGRLIRIMPNLPVKYQEGVTLLTSESSQADLPRIEQIFSKLGTTLVVNEKEFEELTLLTGSGPAFFYDFCSTLISAFDSLTPEKREFLVRKVLMGTAKMAFYENQSLEEMKNAVTSKGGVTKAVLEEWEQLKMNHVIKKGINSGKLRANHIKASLQN